jgi:metal-sulfur cluster biosynthetic enzyme
MNKDKIVTKKQIEKVLKTIPDPELGISVLDLGLIYEINIEKGNKVKITMTLTSIGCPLFNLIADPIKDAILKIPGVQSVYVDLTFEPPWNIELMSPEAKMQLGMA